MSAPSTPRPVTVRRDPDAAVTAQPRLVAAGCGSSGKGIALRLAMVLTPRPAADAAHGLSLRDWPSAVAARFKAGAGRGRPALDVEIAPASGASREPTSPVTVKAARAARTLPDPQDVTAYWHEKMGVGTSPWTTLSGALAPEPARPAAAASPAAAAGAAAPDAGAPGDPVVISPTGRAEAALLLTLERAKQVARRLLGSSAPTRAVAEPTPPRAATRILTRLAAAGESGLGWGQLALAAAAANADVGDAEPAHREVGRRRARAVSSHHRLYLAAATPTQAVAVAAAAPAPRGPALDAIARGIAKADGAIDRTPLAAANDARAEVSVLPPEGGKDDQAALDKFNAAWEANKLPDATQAAKRRLVALQAYPSLSRLFNLIVDLELDWRSVEAVLRARLGGGTLPDGDHFLFLALASGQLPAPPGAAALWTTAKLRLRGGRPVGFWPCQRQELDGAAAGAPLPPEALEQVDGLFNLGTAGDGGPRFDLVTLDAQLSIESDAQDEATREQRLAGASAPNGPTLPREGLDLTDGHALDRHSLRTGGLALIDRGRADQVQRLHAAADDHRATAAAAPAPAIVLDASDLVLGHRLDVGVRGGGDGARRWRPLMDRVITFGVNRSPGHGRKPERWTSETIGGVTVDAAISGLYPSDQARRNADGAMAAAPVATSPKGDKFAEEIIGTWDGDPMGVTCRRVTLQIPAGDLAIGSRLRLRDRAEAPGAIPPPLRLGWQYHVGSRAVFAGGVSLSEAEGAEAYEAGPSGTLTLPQTSAHALGPGRAVRRHERIDAPSVVLTQQALAGATTRAVDGAVTVELPALPALPVDHANHMVIRRMAFPTPAPPAPGGADLRGAGDRGRSEAARRHLEAKRRAGPPLSRRAVLPPNLALDAASRHDVFRAYGAGDFETVAPVGPGGAAQVRPRGGLRGIDYDASWGGFPVLRQTGTDTLEILRDLDGAVAGGPATPAGDALFCLPGPGARRSRAAPFYPDPCAEKLVISATVPGADAPVMLAVPFYRQEHVEGLAPQGYPDALPVIIDLVPDDAPNAPALAIRSVGPQQGLACYRADGTMGPPWGANPSGRHVLVRRVEVALAPGVDASVSLWCLPSLAALSHAFDVPESLGILAACDGATPEARIDAFKALTGTVLAAAGVVERGGIGGLASPDEDMRKAIAKILHDRMGQAPIAELAASTALRATYAVNLPTLAPALDARSLHLLRVDAPTKSAILGFDPGSGAPSGLQDPAAWTPDAQVPGAVEVLIAGTVSFDAASTDAIDVLARGAAAATGTFDDPLRGRSRDSHARGLWPLRASGDYLPARSLFGFDVGDDGRATLTRDEVTLLKVKRLGAAPGPDGGPASLDLLAVQRGEAQHAPTAGGDDDDPDRPVIERLAGFVDGKARLLDVRAVGHGRHAGLFRTRTDAVLEDAELAGPSVPLWLNATRRPDRISPRSLLPAFCWPPLEEAIGVVRTMLVRVRVRRPWFTSGEGERLGIVLWPPDLFEIDPVLLGYDLVPRPVDDLGRSLMAIPAFSDEQLGPGGSFVTRWGADPIRGGPTPDGWLLSSANFPGWVDGPGPDGPGPDAVLVRDVLMPLPREDEAVDTHRSAEDFMRVALLTYEARFDPEQEYWYADVLIDPGQVPDPFLRLGLVRFQPHAPRALQVSEPVVEWVQVLPKRTVSVDRTACPCDAGDKGQARIDLTRVTVNVTGAGSTAAYPGSDKGDKRQLPVMAMRIVQRSRAPSGLWCEAPLIDAAGRECILEDLVPKLDDHGLRWRGEFVVPAQSLASPAGHLSIAVEETEWRRPASYPVEPVDAEGADDALAQSGPRFAAKVDLPGA